MNPRSVEEQIGRIRAVPFDAIAEAMAGAALPAGLRYVPDFDSFEGYVRTWKVAVGRAVKQGRGLVVLL